MNIAIISSTKDPASVNIKESLINSFEFNKLEEQFDNYPIFQLKNNNNEIKIIKLYTINTELIFTDDLDKKIDADIFVFISKHRAEEGRASLTTHAIGNFGKAEHGGKENTICISPSFLLKNIFIELEKNVKESEYEATLEATHHGPFMEKPLLFVELGSNEKYWNDKNGANIISKSLINAIRDNNKLNSIDKNHNNKNILKNKNNNELKNKNYESTFVIGGTHYSYVANKAMLKSNIAVGHICPKYNFENLNEKMLKQTMEKIIPKPKFVLLDWKGLGKEKQRILALLEKNNVEYKRSDQFFK